MLALCPKCGASVKDDDEFCPSCGQSLKAGQPARVQARGPSTFSPPTRSQRTRRRNTVIGLVVLVIVVVAGIAVVLGENHGPSKQTYTIVNSGTVELVSAGQAESIVFGLIPATECAGSICSATGPITYTLTGAFTANGTVTVYLMNQTAYETMPPATNSSYYYTVGSSFDINLSGLGPITYVLVFDNTNGTAGVSVTLTKDLTAVGTPQS